MNIRQKTPVYGAGRSKLKNTSHEGVSTLGWLMLFGIALFMFVAPFHAALFYGYTIQYEYKIQSAIMLSGMLLFLLAIHFFSRWRFVEMRDLLSVAVWTIPLSYVLSSFSAVSAHFASNMIYMNLMYAGFFVVAVWLARNKTSAFLLQQSIVYAGYVVVLYCYMNMFGNAYYRDAVMLTDQGLRLTSVFQYANAYAAYLLALLPASIWLVMNSRKWYAILGHSLMLLPVMLSFFLTLSRGGIVVLPLILLAILPFFTLIRQIAFFIYLGIVSVGAMLILEPVSSKTEAIVRAIISSPQPEQQLLGFFSAQSISGWLLVIGASAVTGGLVFCIQRWLVPLAEARFAGKLDKRFMHLLLPLLLIIASGLGAIVLSGNSFVTRLLPEELQQRLASINFQQHSVLERLTMYKDSLKIISDYPITGGGGGAWVSLYQQYQNNPYIVKQVHNFFLQYLVETGIVGFICLIGVLGLAFYSYIRHYFFTDRTENGKSHQIFYIVAVSILVHSLLDFEMSYVYLASLVFLCLGGMASRADKPLRANKEAVASKGFLRFVYPALIGVVSIVVFYSAAVQLKSNQLFMQANDMLRSGSNSSFEDVMKPLEAALGYSQAHPDYLNVKLQLLYHAYNQSNNASFEQEANRTLALLQKEERYNKEYFEIAYDQYVQTGRLEEALSISQKMLDINLWGVSVFKDRPNWYERTIALHYEIGDKARLINRQDVVDKQWSQAYALYEKVKAQAEALKLLPKGQMQGEPFGVTPAMSLFIGQAKFQQKDYAAALEALRRNVSTDYNVPINRHISRWYLAALQMKGESDPAVYSQLTAKFPEEKDRIAELVANVK